MSGVINLLGGVWGEFNRNDSTYSFLSRERYQIDLKFCHLSDLEFLAAFKGNNDFGALLGLDMGTAEVVRTHTAQDNPCGIGRSQPPQNRSLLSPKLRHFLLKFRVHFDKNDDF